MKYHTGWFISMTYNDFLTYRDNALSRERGGKKMLLLVDASIVCRLRVVWIRDSHVNASTRGFLRSEISRTKNVLAFATICPCFGWITTVLDQNLNCDGFLIFILAISVLGLYPRGLLKWSQKGRRKRLCKCLTGGVWLSDKRIINILFVLTVKGTVYTHIWFIFRSFPEKFVIYIARQKFPYNFF